jgi:hypothetical protein
MAMGPGKYDATCTQVRKELQADGVLLIVLGGKEGPGFSAQLSALDTLRIPQLLRMVADQIEQGGTA